jgi:hypothetical protein
LKWPTNQQELTAWVLEHQGGDRPLVLQELDRKIQNNPTPAHTIDLAWAEQWVAEREWSKEIGRARREWPDLPVEILEPTVSGRQQVYIAGVRVI